MNPRRIFSLFAALLVTVNVAAAQELAPYEVVADGRQYQITMGPDQRNLKAISVFFVSKGNVSNAVQLSVTGPVGLKGVARGGFIGKMKAKRALAAKHRNIK